ncbi:MAG: hypothetical protein ABSF14_06745 [Terriglobia bacterium]|jgi:hypothetical protein
MNFIIQIALTFFLIQFLVVLTIMVVALLIAQPEVPLLGLGSGREALARSFTFVVGLPGRMLRAAARLVRLVHAKLTSPAYHY